MRYWSVFYSSVMILAAAAASVPATAATDGVITTDIAVSEWGTSENLSLNMRTGEYTVTPFPHVYSLTKHDAPLSLLSQHGTLRRDELQIIQPFYRNAMTQGLVNAQCDQDPQQNRLIIGNGAVPLLMMKTGEKVYRAARSYQCWTPAARALNRKLDEIFYQVTRKLSATSATLHATIKTATSAANNTTPLGVVAFVQERHLTRYSFALANLTGDNRPEALIYAMGTTGSGTADLCGSGGCELYVLLLSATGFRQVANISISRPPIRVLPTITNWWHDLSVMVAGGGITPGYEARLSFDGHTYPSNPSMPPATRLEGAAGQVVIASMPVATPNK